MNLKIFIPLYFFFSSIFIANYMDEQKDLSKNGSVEWRLSDIFNSVTSEIKIIGNPKIIQCKYGEAIEFNGKSDGILLDSMPLSDLSQFTIEAIVRFDFGGNTEQRFFHIGDVKGNRVLLEIRSSQTNWYFDAFIKAGEQQKTLIDPKLLHPLDQWYSVAFVMDNGELSTYINGKKELEGQIKASTLPVDGRSSIGMRQNMESWFKGAIYKIKITPKALDSSKFICF